MKTVLLITMYYPPCNHTASKRPACFAKYLENYGWQPLVLCRQWTKDNCIYDPEFMTNINEQVFIREIPGDDNGSRSFLTPFKKAHTLFFPHHAPHILRKNALQALPDIFSRYPIDAIWATCPSDLPLYLAAMSSRQWKVPWVADFRDVWDQPYMGPRVLVPSHLFHEKRLLKSASAVVTVSEGLADILRARYRRTIHIFPNGFDPADLAPMGACSLSKFNIVYTGNLIFPQRDPRPVLDALGLLIGSGEISEEDVVMEFYGVREDLLSSHFSGHKYYHLVNCTQRLPRMECIKRQRSSAVLLQLAHAGEKGIMTGKMFDYLAARRPILAVPNDGDCIDQFLRKTNAGMSCSTAEDIAAQLRKWYREWKATGTVVYQGTEEAIMKYSCKEQANQLAKLLDGVIRKRMSNA